MTQIWANGFEAPSWRAEVDTIIAGNGAVSTDQTISQSVPASAYPSARQITGATGYVPGGTGSFPVKPEGASATYSTPEDEPIVQDHINEDSERTPQGKTLYQKAQDWIGDRVNEMRQAIQNPGEGLKGAVKEVLNMPAGLWNAAMLAGTAQAGSDLQQGAMFRSGPDGDKMMQLGQDMIQNPAKYAAPGMVEEPFKMSNPAQQGGADIFNVASIAAAGGGAAKALLKGAKAVGELGEAANLAANTANGVGELGRGANLAADLAKAAERGGVGAGTVEESKAAAASASVGGRSFAKPAEEIAPLSQAPSAPQAGTPGAVQSTKGTYPDFNPQGGTTNCGACTDAVDTHLAGQGTNPAAPGPRGWPNRATTWNFNATPNSIENALQTSGDGARGMVYVTDGQNAHVFNALNQNGQIIAIDGQSSLHGSITEVAASAGYSGPGISWGWSPTSP